MRKEWVFALMILGVILFSGCIRQPKKPPTTGLGVVIKSLSVDPSQLEPKTQAIVSLTVQNQGGAKATNVHPDLIGLPRGADEWKVSGPTADYFNLFPPNPERGVPEGQEQYVSWILTAPSKEVTVPYDFEIRVSYKYSTSATSVIRLLTMEYYRELPKAEKETARKGIVNSKFTPGPLEVKFAAPSPIISNFTELNKSLPQGLPVQIQVNNVGGGKVKDNLIKIDSSGSLLFDCPPNATLINNQYASFNCYLRDSNSSLTPPLNLTIGNFTNFKDFEAGVTLSYTYFTEKWTSVTVLKKMTLGLIPPSALK